MGILTEVAQQQSLADDIKDAASSINVNKHGAGITLSRGKMSGRLARALAAKVSQKEEDKVGQPINVQWTKNGYEVSVEKVDSEDGAIAKLAQHLPKNM